MDLPIENRQNSVITIWRFIYSYGIWYFYNARLLNSLHFSKRRFSRVFAHTNCVEAAKTTPHAGPIVEITRPVAVASCAECAPSGRLQSRPPASLCSWVWENR